MQPEYTMQPGASFAKDLIGYKQDGASIPDPLTYGLDPEMLKKILGAFFAVDAQGRSAFDSEVKKKRVAKGTKKAPTPRPMVPTPGSNNIVDGTKIINEGNTAEEMYKKLLEGN